MGEGGGEQPTVWVYNKGIVIASSNNLLFPSPVTVFYDLLLDIITNNTVLLLYMVFEYKPPQTCTSCTGY